MSMSYQYVFVSNVCFFPSLLQLVSFGLSNEMMVTFKDENLMTFKHLFLKGYKDQRLGSYALYTKEDVYDHIYYIINGVLTFWIVVTYIKWEFPV